MRDYGTATWEGGDAECDHKTWKGRERPELKGCTSWSHRDATPTAGDCPKCGAKRIDRQLGLEPTFEEYISKLCDIYDEVKRVLRKDGTCFVNLGDTYGGPQGEANKPKINPKQFQEWQNAKSIRAKLPAKSLCLIPQRFAIEMVNRGWILRNVIIWKKPNPMPSSAKDRFTVDFEYIYFFCKAKEKSNDIKQWLHHPLAKEDASWLAAMVDGEGTIGIRRSKIKEKNDTFGAYLTVSNSCLPLLEKCQRITNLGKIKDSGAYTNFKVYRWEIVHNQAVSVIGEIYPYLIQKREQSKCAIAIQKMAVHLGSPKGKNKQPRMSNAVLQEKMRLWALCKSLNQKQVESSGLPEPNLNRTGGCEDYWFEPQYEPQKNQYYFERYTPVPAKDTKRRQLANQSDIKIGGGFAGSRAETTSRMNPLGRNKRCIWTIPTQPFPEAHFATYPEKLVEPMIKAGCPEFICTKCGKAREKIYKKSGGTTGKSWHDHSKDDIAGMTQGRNGLSLAGWKRQKENESQYIIEDIGYTDCGCNADWRPGVVLDCFRWFGNNFTGGRPPQQELYRNRT